MALPLLSTLDSTSFLRLRIASWASLWLPGVASVLIDVLASFLTLSVKADHCNPELSMHHFSDPGARVRKAWKEAKWLPAVGLGLCSLTHQQEVVLEES